MSNGKIISNAFCFGSIHDFKLLLKSKTFIHPEKHFNFHKKSWYYF
ncbi:hypothetical protein [Spiroplasma endosymbiont of Zeiraphera isertana]